jgi:hypothetical protein
MCLTVFIIVRIHPFHVQGNPISINVEISRPIFATGCYSKIPAVMLHTTITEFTVDRSWILHEVYLLAKQRLLSGNHKEHSCYGLFRPATETKEGVFLDLLKRIDVYNLNDLVCSLAFLFTICKLKD